MEYRFGQGYDVHAIAEGLPMFLCGVKIESPVGFVAHSTLAGVMGVTEDRVSVKATTTEKLGFVGRREGCEVWAVACIMK